MSVKFDRYGDSLTFYIYGEIDEYSAKGMRVEIDNIIDSNCDANIVTFDLSAVSFMDSTGIGMFIGRYKKLKSLKFDVYITGACGNLEKILELSGIYRLIIKK